MNSILQAAIFLKIATAIHQLNNKNVYYFQHLDGIDEVTGHLTCICNDGSKNSVNFNKTVSADELDIIGNPIQNSTIG